MNFTREPILETIISAKEGYKLKLKNTRTTTDHEYLVDAVQVVSFGTTFFYRSCESTNFFMIPAQEFEIIQVRQSRLLLKVPTEKSIKIAGGNIGAGSDAKDKAKEKNNSKKTAALKDKQKNEKKNKENSIKMSVNEVTGNTDNKNEGGYTQTDKRTKANTSKKEIEKKPKQKETKSHDKKSLKILGKKPSNASKKNIHNEEKISNDNKNIDMTTKDNRAMSSPLFSNLLRPPEVLISDNIKKYHDMLANNNNDIKNMNKEDIPSRSNKQPDVNIDDSELFSESPKPFEQLEEDSKNIEKEADEIEGIQEIKQTLSIKERVKKVLLPPSSDKKNEDEK